MKKNDYHIRNKVPTKTDSRSCGSACRPDCSGQTDETTAGQTSHTIGNKIGITTKRYPDDASGGQTETAALELTLDGEALCQERGVAMVGETNQNTIEGDT